MNYITALESFIQDLIECHSTKTSDCNSLFLDQLPFYKQKILLSHILSASDYEDACANYSRTLEYINEHRKFMQDLLDESLNDLYIKRMKERGIYIYQHSNGDVSWQRR